MDAFLQDLRYTLRTFRNAPGFSAVAVLTLALGIGVVTTMFSVVNAVLVRGIPHVEQAGLVRLFDVNRRDGERISVSPGNFADWQARARSFAAMGVYHDSSLVYTGPSGEAEQLEGEAVSPGLFRLAGARPHLGRLFLPEEGVAGRSRVVLLSHHEWTRRFGADPSLVGRTLMLDGAAHTVVGVMPPKFGFPDNQVMWVPYVAPAEPARGWHHLRAIARLKPGVTPDEAAAELAAIAAEAERSHPETNAETGADVVDFHEANVGEIRPVLLVMMAAVGFVLLIACANLANLFLARANGRRREIAVRMAMGAGRGRIVRQLLTEGAVVAVLGGALGIVLAVQGLALILGAFPFQPPLWMSFDLDATVLGFTLAVSLGTAVLFALAPALRATRGDLQGTLRDGGRGSTAGAGHARLRGSLVAAELALATVLLVGALLMVRSFLHLYAADPGFDTAGLLTLRTYVGGPRYAAEEARRAFHAQVLEGARATPGVRAAALATRVPLGDYSETSSFAVEGREAPGTRVRAQYRGVSDAFFEVLGVPLAAGRAFTAQEVADAAPVVVVGASTARRHWPDGRALGARIRFGGDWMTVVGIVPDLRLRGVNDRAEDQVYAPYTVREATSMALVARTAGEPAGFAPSLRAMVRGVDAAVPVNEVHTLAEVLDRSLWRQRLFGGMFAAFAAIALLLAATGVYGTMAYTVSQRTHEIGVRMALGASAGTVRRMVVGQGMRVAGLGVAIGLAAALGVSGVMRSMLYGVTPTDPVTFGGIAGLLAAVALTACLLPAVRASRVDPMDALRAE